MYELKFSRVDNGKYNSKSITIEKGLLMLKENYEILMIEKTKCYYKKAVVQLNNPDLLERIKQLETQINGYLDRKYIEPVTLLYGNKIYPKTLLNCTKKKRNNFINYIKLKSIWINDKNKPFIQLWLL